MPNQFNDVHFEPCNTVTLISCSLHNVSYSNYLFIHNDRNNLILTCFSEQSNTCRKIRAAVAVAVSMVLVVSIICTVGLYVKPPGQSSKGYIKVIH